MAANIGGMVMAVLPSAVYVPTYFDMLRYGKRFTPVLLWQAVLMVSIQLLLLRLSCVLRKGGHVEIPKGQGSEVVLVQGSSLAWMIAAYALTTSLVCFLLIPYPSFVEAVGALSVTLEACMAIPQVLDNHRRKSTQGLSVVLVLSWIGGDLFKTFFFLVDRSPVQFVMCGCAQIAIDLVVVAQMYAYRRHTYPGGNVKAD